MKKRFIAMATLLFLLLFVFIGCNPTKKEQTYDEFYSNWMSYVKDDAKITNIAIPGSHDAGSYKMMYLAETQSYSIKQQLQAGVRYFDIRVSENEDKLVIFHSFIEGIDFNEVIADIKSFVDSNPSELLILDFQHFKEYGYTPTVEEKVLAQLEDKLDVNNTAVLNTADISTLTYGQCKKAAKSYIITWGSETTKDKPYLFTRNGLNGVMESTYIGDEHKKGGQYLVDTTLPKYLTDFNGDKLFVLQSQLTAPNLLVSPISMEKKWADTITNYIKSIADNPTNLAKVNIIMRDYINTTQTKINAILQLNISKGDIIDDMTTFSEKIK